MTASAYGGGATPLTTALIQDPSDVDGVRAEWDALAVLVGAPFGAPAWVEAWWRHLAPAGARLSIVVAHAGGELVGVAPFYASERLGVTELRLLSGGLASRLGILAKPQHQTEFATALARTLTADGRRVDALRWEAVDGVSPWPGWLSAAWPGDREHRLREESRRSAPLLHLAQGSYQDWLAAKSRNFRSQMRRRRRALEDQGASVRAADSSTLERDLGEFWRLHRARWKGRGGSSAADAGTVGMLQQVGAELTGSGRFRLWVIDGPAGEAISAQVFVAAGGTVAYWNGGFDERWAASSPGAVAILAAVEEAFERGDQLIDLGGGEARYKERLADEDRPVCWSVSYPPGPRYPLARMRRLPEQTARRGSRVLRERLGQERVNRLRRLIRR